MRKIELIILRDAMQEAAAKGGAAAREFGKDSPKHLEMRALFNEARLIYEEACADAGVPAYVTYDD